MSNNIPRPPGETLSEEEARAMTAGMEEQQSLSHLIPSPKGVLTVLVDTDIPVYKVAAIADGKHYLYRGKKYRYKKDAVKACTDEGNNVSMIEEAYSPWSEDKAIKALESTLGAWEKAFPGAAFIYCLSSPLNFRYEIFPEYKSARKGKRKPYHRATLTKYVIEKLNGVTMTGYEADDVVGILQEQTKAAGVNTPIICSIDKDLLCIPGLHWNPDKGTVNEVSELEAFRNFGEQVLKGDSTDSIPGLKRVGPATATKILADCDSVESIWDTVRETYLVKKGESEEYLHQMASMVWIHRKPGTTYLDYIGGDKDG